MKSESDALALPINLLKMQNLSCQLRPTESELVVSKDPKEKERKRERERERDKKLEES